jgi:hypothetical protein
MRPPTTRPVVHSGKGKGRLPVRSHYGNGFSPVGTMWGLRTIAKLVQITPMSLWDIVDIILISIHGVYKPTYN